MRDSKGRWNLLSILVILIFASSFIAHVLSTNGFTVNVKDLYIDSEGAVMNATLYTPLGIDVNDKLPAIVLTHGSGVSHGVMAGTAEELARRGFVVLNVSAYGSGSSETSDPTIVGRSLGLYDAVLYLRTLKYVDQTRLGITGHSAGARRITAAALSDATYYSLNDLMINNLCDKFGQKFTKQEIYMDADTLARQRLSADQLVYYSELKKEAAQYLSVRIKAVLNIGDGTTTLFAPLTVKVGGYDVQRTPQVNGGFLVGIFNEGSARMAADNLPAEKMRTIYQTGNRAVEPDIWYHIQPYAGDAIPSSTQLGNVWKTSITSSPDLVDALKNKCARIFFTPPDHHSQDFISPAATSDIVKFFEQALSYNNGELTDPNTKPVDARSSIFLLREMLNGFAMVALFVVLVPLAAILLETPFFKACKFEVPAAKSHRKDKVFWIISAAMVALSCWAICWVGAHGMGLNIVNKFFSLDSTVNILIGYMVIMAVGIVIALGIYAIVVKKKAGENIFKPFNLNIDLSAMVRTFLLAYILFVLAYISMAVLKFLFNEDYRFWMAAMTKMMPQNLLLMFRYGLVVFPTFVAGGLLINFGRMRDMQEGRNTLLNVVLNVLGLYGTAVASYGYMYISYYFAGKSVMPFAIFVTTWTLLIVVPLTAYISRKMYNITGSIWLGAYTNTLLVTWMFCSSLSSSTMNLNGDVITKWLGI